MSKTLSKEAVGFFPAKFQIGGDMPGAPTLSLNLGVDTPHESVSGIAELTQAVNPPLDIKSKIMGDFTYMCTMQNCHILVVCTGYPNVKWPAHGGVGPVLMPNLHIRMVLTEDWKSGTANYSYLNADGAWIDVKQAPVKLID